jgi:hypothetical protein
MATDFSFDAQKSYSPLLAALAQAPVQREQLRIQMEQNQRKRLSDLLDNMASASKTARDVQSAIQTHRTMSALSAVKQHLDVQDPTGVTGSMFMSDPGSFLSSGNALGGQIQGVKNVFNTMAPQAPAQPNVAGEGVTANDQSVPQPSVPGVTSSPGMGGMDQNAMIQRSLKRAMYGEPKEGTDANTGLSMQYYPGTGIPPTTTNPPAEGELPPVQKASLLEHVGKFRSDPAYKDFETQIQAARQLKMVVNSKNPIARLNAIAGQVREAGINRVTLPELSMGGHDPSTWESLKQRFETAASGKFTEVNTQELNALADMMTESAQAGMKNLAGSYSGDYKTINKSVNPKIVDDVFGNALSPHMKGAIIPKPFEKGAATDQTGNGPVRKFANEAAAMKSKLPKGSIVIINGRRARID